MAATKKRATATKTKKKSVAKKTAVSRGLFHPVQDTVPFFTFQVSRQTIYWLILCGIVLIFGLWIIHLQLEIEHIYDTIDLNSINFSNIPGSAK